MAFPLPKHRMGGASTGVMIHTQMRVLENTHHSACSTLKHSPCRGIIKESLLLWLSLFLGSQCGEQQSEQDELTGAGWSQRNGVRNEWEARHQIERSMSINTYTSLVLA